MKEIRKCIICNAEFECNVKVNKKTCSISCSHKNHDNSKHEYNQTPENKTKINERQKKLSKLKIKLHRWYKSDSFPHEEFEKFLVEIEK